MSQKNRTELRKKDFLVIRQTRNQNIAKIVTPQTFQVGLDDSEFQSGLIVKGSTRLGGRLLDGTGQAFIKGSGAVSVTEDSSGGVTISATLGTGATLSGVEADGIEDFTYDGSSPVSIAVDLYDYGGIVKTSNGLGLNISDLSQELAATPHADDLLFIYDDSDPTTRFTKKIKVSNLLAAAPAHSVLSNSASSGDGLSGGSFDNSADVTFDLNLASNAGLNIVGGIGSGGALYVDPNRATVTTSLQGSADYVLIYDGNVGATRKVLAQKFADQGSTYSLSAGTGLTGTAYNGSANRSLAIDTSVVPRLSSTNTFTSTNTFSGNLIASTGLTGSLQEVSAGVPYLVAGSNVTIATGSNGQITIAAVLGAGSTLSNGPGIGTLAYDGTGNATVAVDTSNLSLESAADRADYLIITDPLSESTVKKIEVGEVADSVDRPSIMSPGEGITITFAGNSNPATIAAKYDGTTIGVDGSGRLTALGGGGGGGGGGGDINAEYLVLSVTGSLNNERALVLSTGLTGSDAGAGGNYTIQTDIVGTGSITVLTQPSGQLVISASDASISFTSGSTSVASISSVDVSQLATVQDLGGGVIALTGSIGNAEDGTYTDGLFIDFNSSTPIGTAVDRFNEVLKGLAPSAAPGLDDIGSNDSGAGANLSFGSSQSIVGYTNAEPSTLTPASNLSDVNINSSYSVQAASNDLRRGCFAGSTTIDGRLNADVSADSPNYPAYAIGNGDQGTLKLFVNDNSTEVHSVDLTAFSSGDSVNGNGTGFVDLSSTMPGHFADGTEFDTFIHRTGSYSIDPADQRDGWNYARVVHEIGASVSTTNYVEWVNDSDANALSLDTSVLDSLAMTGLRKLSGARYFTGGTAEYRARVQNAYRNIYPTSNITFNGTRCGVSAQSFPTINFAGGEDETKALNITGSATINTDPILNNSISVSLNVPAVLKSSLSAVGSQSISGILLYNLSNTSTVTSETFRAENYRLISGSYAGQSDVTDAANTWDSDVHMTGSNAGYEDGLLFYNSALRKTAGGGVSGDFRNTADGGSITNGPNNNVDYSGETTGLKTFYRYFQNNSGGSKSNFSITINGTGTIVSRATSLSGNNIRVLIKLPTTSVPFETGWMDLAVPFATGDTNDGDGCLDGALDSSLNATNNATFGVESAGSNEYIVVKVEADASWTGNISSMSITWT